jgi:branched-chain amino acid transport system permease protein
VTLLGDLWPLAVIGLFNGAIYGLAAMGVVLTYKTSGIFNFAYGAVAMFAGFTFWQLRDGWGLNQWIAIPLLLFVFAPLMGLALERLFRPVTALSAEIQIVIALGVLAFLQALALLIWGGSPKILTSIFPTTTFSFTSKLNVSYSQLYTLLLAVAMGVGLWALLRHTRLGTATQAVVDNRDLAELNGVSGDAVSRTAWTISTMFAALVGVLLSGQSRLNVYELVLVVIFAFAPAVLGKLVSLPLAFVGALALGVGQGIASHWGSSGNLANLYAAVPYLALFALLLFYGGKLKELRASFQPVTSTPGSGPSSTRRLITIAAVFAAVALLLPALVNDARLGNITAGAVYATIALTLVVLTGWTGQISLAQFSFVGIGAFTVGHVASANGAGFFWAAFLGFLIAMPVGLIVGLPSLRLSGLYLALATMAFALTLDTLVFSRRGISGGISGMTIPRPRVGSFSFASTTRFYYLAVAVFAVFAVGAMLFQRGPIGRRLQMIRDAPLAASTFGVNLTLTKLSVFALSGAGAAFAGAMFGALRRSVSPNDFGFSASLALLLLVVLGGRALVGGAMIAGAVYTLQILPGLSPYLQYIQLFVAVGVVYVAQYPDGPITVAAHQSRRYSDLLRSLPQLIASSDSNGSARKPQEASSG